MAEKGVSGTGTAYLAMDGLWYSLPIHVRHSTYWGFHNAFKLGGKSKYMTLVGVDHQKVPTSITPTDAIIHVCATGVAARDKLKKTVLADLQNAQHSIPLPEYFSKEVDVGRSYCFKKVLGPSDLGPTNPTRSRILVSVARCVVSFEGALGWWRYFTKEKRKVPMTMVRGSLKMHVRKDATVNWIRKAQADWQKWFGVSLGRMIAHEVYHTIWSQNSWVDKKGKKWFGAEHIDNFYLESTGGGKYWYDKDINKGFGEDGKYWIKDVLPKLAKLEEEARRGIRD